jgi:transcriptional regulator with XRE-family HTH domain
MRTMTPSAFSAWRRRMGWSREQAAQRLMLSVPTVKAYELGQRTITARVLAQTQQLERAQASALPPSVPGAPIRIVGGGTSVDVRTHLALSCKVYGTTAKALATLCASQGHPSELILTRMADPASPYETNADLAVLANDLVADPAARIVFWNPAVCDFEGQVGDVPSGPKAPRLKSRDGEQWLRLTPANKLVGRLRRTRKDLFLVAFKTTAGATPDEQYAAGLGLLKEASANLVLANDVVTRHHIVIVPEEARYHETDDREEALAGLVEMALLRATNTFTRSTVIEGPGVAWGDPTIPDNLRQVVDHCIARGAYKPFRGKTVGHFAVRGPAGSIITSRRKANFNDLPTIGMVKLHPTGPHEVAVEGGKPSVGGMSQRIIFDRFPDADNIVHFHCPLRPRVKDVPIRDQRPFECGSHECGRNTADGLAFVEDGIRAVMLDQHGPNIVYGKEVPAEKVIAFIERHFDLSQKTGGLIA